MHSGKSSENEYMGHFVSLPSKSDENGVATTVKNARNTFLGNKFPSC